MLQSVESQVIGGYRVVRLLGRGGMGVVYEVESSGGRRFALKLFSGVKKNEEFLKDRFCTEARLLSRLSHQNLVKVYDAGTDESSGEPYFVMDLVLGAGGEPTTLETLRSNGAVSAVDAQRWFSEVAGVLGYLARHGVVHRDVKLENILVDADGHAHLSDFGVSRVFGDELKDALAVATTFVDGESTGTRPVMGTYFYLAPEVRSGSQATPESDLYALGVTFFRLLTGMWYEPGVNAADMLAPFDRFWRERLPQLLVADPAERRFAASGQTRGRVVIAVAALVVAALALSVCLCMSVSRARRGSIGVATLSQQLPPDGGIAEFGSEMTLDLGGGEKMSFSACPAGVFMMSSIGNVGPDCHKVTITRPYWLGKTFVSARQFALEFPDAARDEVARKWESAFPDMSVVCRVYGKQIDEYISRLNMKFGAKLPRGYVFRLPTEAELEYAIREGGQRPAQRSDVWWDARETRRRAEAAGVEMRDDLRLVPKSSVSPGSHAFGLVSLWTDTEQAVLDTVDGTPGTKTSSSSISYAEEETDPLRAGALRLSRQAHLQRWLMKEPSGFVRVCIGPSLPGGGR